MDYAYSPLPDHGSNLFYSIYRRMFPHRPQTTLINEPGMTIVEEFLDHVETEPGLSRPVGSFLIASHGSDGGYIQMEIDTVSHQDPAGNAISGTTYEVLVNVDNNDTVNIPNALITPRPDGSPPIAVFHIRGCNVGAALPYMQKFKAALGGNVEVSAPKVFDSNQEMGRGAFEYLGYNFKILRRDAFANRNQVVTAFQNHAPAFTFIDGSAVPNGEWANWIPNNVGRGQRNRTPEPFWNFGQSVEGQNRIRLPVQFRHNFPASVGRFTFTVGGFPNNPGNEAARLQELRDAINAHPEFQAAHDFPVYQRYGYASANDFVDGFDWNFNWNAPNLVCTGRRHVYNVSPPVTDPATGNLLFNYYPDDNNAANVVETLAGLAAASPAQFQQLFQVV